MRHALLVARIELDMRWRAFYERMRYRLLKLLPRSFVYHVLIHAWANAIRSDEHPDAPRFSEIVKRWQ